MMSAFLELIFRCNERHIEMTMTTCHNRLQRLALTLSCLCILFLPVSPPAAGEQVLPCTYLLEAAGSGNLDEPRYVLGEFETGFDPKVHTTGLEYFKTHPELLEQIRTDLGGGDFRWRLDSLAYRMLYATETRPEYITQFESYCKEVIGEVLGVLQLPNPYARITTLTAESLPLEKGDGLSAYIVRDLAKEYQATYEFRNASDERVVIELSGQFSSGEVGSYSSSLTFDDNGGVHFIHDTHTIWQNSARNPYTVLMTPVEETLHVLLRESTEAAIRRAVETHPGCNRKEAEKIVDEWISVEEAIVGGLVYHLLPPILEGHVGAIPDALISSDIETKKQFLKYSKLGDGIQLVATRGTRACLEMYLENPEAIRDLLT